MHDKYRAAVFVVVVLTLTHGGQAPITLERKNTSGGKQNQKIIHKITETNRIPKTKKIKR